MPKNPPGSLTVTTLVNNRLTLTQLPPNTDICQLVLEVASGGHAPTPFREVEWAEGLKQDSRFNHGAEYLPPPSAGSNPRQPVSQLRTRTSEHKRRWAVAFRA